MCDSVAAARLHIAVSKFATASLSLVIILKMEFNSFAVSSSDEDSRFWIRSTQVGQQVPRSQLFAFELPTDEDFKDQLAEEQKQQVSRPPRHLKTKTKTVSSNFICFEIVCVLIRFH